MKSWTMLLPSRYAILAILLALNLILGSCGSPTIEDPTPPPVELKVEVLPYLSFAPFFVAQEEGFIAGSAPCQLSDSQHQAQVEDQDYQ